ncbi:MAG: ABC transporter ATP-binding protein [Candidatus Woesearchaeota archaeon]
MVKELILKLQNVWKIYKMGYVEVNALKGVSMEIEQGDFVAIVGASGSGKSTLMNLVGCLDLPSKGEVYLENKDIAKLSESALSQIRGRKIGFIFQQFNLVPTLSALENVMLPMEFQDTPVDESKKKAEKLLALVGLADRMHHLPNQLSGGQQQRVAIARALSNDPDVVLADEPTGNLDSKSGMDILSLLQGLWKKEHKTIIIVTHDLDLAARARRKIQLKDGQIVKGE